MNRENIPAIDLTRARAAFAERGPAMNYELNHDGTEDKVRAAYVEGWADGWHDGVPYAIAAYQTKPLPDDPKRVSAVQWVNEYGSRHVCESADIIANWLTKRREQVEQWRDLDGLWWHTSEDDQ